MRLFNAFLEGFYGGLAPATPCGHVDRLCAENGWPVARREADAIHLHFRSAGGVRQLRILGLAEAFSTFVTPSQALVPLADVSHDILGYLLCRNLGRGPGAWGMHVAGGHATFCLVHRAPAAGLDARSFRHVCEAMAAEAEDFDGQLRRGGLLQ